MAHLWRVTLRTLVFADDVKVRWLMALASIGWAIELVVRPDTLDRPYYILMRAMLPSWGWALAFLAHGIGALWRIYERRERERWALAINAFGAAVWFAATLSQDLAAHRFLVSSSLEFIACLFLLGTFVSTGRTSKSTTT